MILKHTVNATLVPTVLFLASAATLAAQPADQTTIVCESLDGERTFCSADTGSGIELVRELGGSACDGNWTFDDQGIWVDKGCRGEFRAATGQAAAPPKQSVIGDLLGALLGGGQQPEGSTTGPTTGPTTVVCESQNGQRTTCPADTSGVVRLSRQLSTAPCTGNWGFGKAGIWVDNGCRAEFELTAKVAQGTGTTGVVTCESREGRRELCPADTSGTVVLVRQLSTSSCAGNWGFDASGIWVDNGCRAEFSLGPQPTPVPPTPTMAPATAAAVTCESRQGRRAYCSADTSRGVRLVRQLSTTSCTGAWGWDADGIWVDNGCRAEFELGALVPTPQPTATPVPPTTLACESREGRRAYCSADTSRGVRLARQLSTTSCTGAWGWDVDGIWVDRGCRAEFELGAAPSATHPAPGSGLTTVSCASAFGRPARCPIPAAGGVRLARTTGVASCAGRWGWDDSSILVTDDCRGEFEVSAAALAPLAGASKLRCESGDGKRHSCPVAITDSVRLLRKLSQTPCAEHWGLDENGIWVDGGCRAEFVVK